MLTIDDDNKKNINEIKLNKKKRVREKEGANQEYSIRPREKCQ